MTEASFDYFTAIEEHFQRARGTGMFHLSPRDLALVEAWKNARIPLEAVLRGIDAVFEKRRSNPRAERVNSVAYCAQAVAKEAQRMVNLTPIGLSAPPFTLDDVRALVARNAAAMHEADYEDLAAALEAIDVDGLFSDLEQLEQQFTAIEEMMIGRAHAAASEAELAETRRSLDFELKPYRGKMTADQIAMLERQFLERRLLEAASLPRLSLFYLHPW